MKFKYLLAFPLIAALTACTSDEPAPVPDTAEVPFHTTMSITLPTSGTRGAVEGEENGQDSENKVSTIKVILTKREGSEGNYTYKKLMTSTHVTPLTGTAYTVVFNAAALKTNPDFNQDGMDVYAFVVCNDVAYTVTDGFNIDATFTGGAPAKFDTNQRAIRMTSAPYKAHLPKLSELLKHDTQGKAYELTSAVNGASGPIKVERSVARFDYKRNTTLGEDKADFFEIKENRTVRGYVQITDMALLNENNEAYYFGRINNTGLESTRPVTHQLVAAVTNLGVIDPANLAYVVSPKALENRVFNYPMEGNYMSTLPYTDISTLSQNDSHTGTWDNDHATDKVGYKIWRYCNENAISASDVNLSVNSNQMTKYTTGIVFRGHIVNGTGDKAIPGFGADELYLFRQYLYGDFAALYRAAYSTGDKANPDLQAAFEATWRLKRADDPANITVYTVTVGDTAKEYVLRDTTPGFRGSKGFTVYKNSGTQESPVYYVYYHYWNRHDDNNQQNVMGAMEFSVVRNNVYKIRINSIGMFGASGTDEDPDKPDPNDPDEKENMYIKVDVYVMPWTVRVNNVDF